MHLLVSSFPLSQVQFSCRRASSRRTLDACTGGLCDRATTRSIALCPCVPVHSNDIFLLTCASVSRYDAHTLGLASPPHRLSCTSAKPTPPRSLSYSFHSFLDIYTQHRPSPAGARRVVLTHHICPCSLLRRFSVRPVHVYASPVYIFDFPVLLTLHPSYRSRQHATCPSLRITSRKTTAIVLVEDTDGTLLF